jgi:hypothetical protein
MTARSMFDGRTRYSRQFNNVTWQSAVFERPPAAFAVGQVVATPRGRLPVVRCWCAFAPDSSRQEWRYVFQTAGTAMTINGVIWPGIITDVTWRESELLPLQLANIPPSASPAPPSLLAALAAWVEERRTGGTDESV